MLYKHLWSLLLSFGLILTAALLLTGAAGPKTNAAGEIPPVPDPIPDNAVIFFEDINYAGHWFMYYTDRDNNDLRSIYVETNPNVNWNDRISSLKVGKNACVTFWKDILYHGSKGSYAANGTSVMAVPSLVGPGWNDKISSLKTRARDNCAKS
jgi:hypothetical protein